MKNILALGVRTISLIFTLAFAFVACETPESLSKPKNFISENGAFKRLDGGIVFYDPDPVVVGGDGGDLYIISLNLYTRAITIVTDDGERELDGAGDLIRFRVASASQELEPGTYTFSESITHGVFGGGNLYIAFNFDTLEGIEGVLVDGEIVVTKERDEYKIVFDAEAETDANNDGQEEHVFLEGSYRGAVEHAAN